MTNDGFAATSQDRDLVVLGGAQEGKCDQGILGRFSA